MASTATARAEPEWLSERRRKGASLAQELALPDAKKKGWEFTDLTGLDLEAYEPAGGAVELEDGGAAEAGALVLPLEVAKGATESRSKVVCDALMLDEESRSDTYPTIRIDESDADVGHEATVSKVGDEQVFYLQSRGLDEEEASKMIVNGFIEPVTKELPMEYAVELNRLIQLEMVGSIG